MKSHHKHIPAAKAYDETVGVLKSAVEKAKLGNEEKLAAIRHLDEQARRLEGMAGGPSFERYMAEERARSHDYGGMRVFDPEPAQAGADSSASRTA